MFGSNYLISVALKWLITVPAFTPVGHHKCICFFGSARAYHCEAQPGAANRYRPTGVKAVLCTVAILTNCQRNSFA
jgi:hypothetical protein